MIAMFIWTIKDVVSCVILGALLLYIIGSIIWAFLAATYKSIAGKFRRPSTHKEKE